MLVVEGNLDYIECIRREYRIIKMVADRKVCRISSKELDCIYVRNRSTNYYIGLNTYTKRVYDKKKKWIACVYVTELQIIHRTE